MTITAEPDVEEWCPVDGCPAYVCGGPHYVVLTTLGREMVRVGESPVGDPL